VDFLLSFMINPLNFPYLPPFLPTPYIHSTCTLSTIGYCRRTADPPPLSLISPRLPCGSGETSSSRLHSRGLASPSPPLSFFPIFLQSFHCDRPGFTPSLPLLTVRPESTLSTELTINNALDFAPLQGQIHPFTSPSPLRFLLKTRVPL